MIQEPLQVNLSNSRFWKSLATRFQPIPAAVQQATFPTEQLEILKGPDTHPSLSQPQSTAVLLAEVPGGRHSCLHFRRPWNNTQLSTYVKEQSNPPRDHVHLCFQDKVYRSLSSLNLITALGLSSRASPVHQETNPVTRQEPFPPCKDMKGAIFIYTSDNRSTIYSPTEDTKAEPCPNNILLNNVLESVLSTKGPDRIYTSLSL